MTDETAAPTPHPEDQAHSGQPICDTCGQRAVWSEIHGWLHAPADRPFGLPTATDPAKHEVTTTEWMATYDQPARPVSHGTEDSDYRVQIAEVLHAAAVDVPGTPQVGPALIERQIAALWPRVSPLVEQLRQARAAYNRMAGHAVDRAAERDRYYLAWQSAARGRRQARQQWQTWQREAEQWQAETVESAKATEGLRAELAAVGRAIECFLGVEYGTPVGSARALVERCADAESALDGLRATAVVLPEDWRQMLADGDYPEQVVDLIESWRAAPVLPVTPDEHVREHDDAAPTRDEVVEAWADTWDGVDRTPEWVRVVEPCPVSDCTIPQVHGHDGYGLRFTPAAQPAHPRPPLDPPPNSLNERLHIRRSGARLGPMDPSDVVKHCVRCGCPQGAHHKLHCDGRLGDCICYGGFEDSPDYVLTALDKVGQAENAEWDAEHRPGGSPGTGTEAGE